MDDRTKTDKALDGIYDTLGCLESLDVFKERPKLKDKDIVFIWWTLDKVKGSLSWVRNVLEK